MATETHRRSPWREWLPWCLIWLWGCVAYHNSFEGVFVYDDFRGILQNPRVLAGPSTQDWLRPVSRPLTEATFALNYAWGGFERWGWHLGNLLVHLTTASLWFWLLRDRLQRHRWSERTGCSDTWTAAVCAGLWVAQPLTTEGVTYLVQRSEALAACGMLATLVCWNRFVLAQRGAAVWLIAAFVCALAAAASKPTAVVLPLLVCLYDGELRRQQGLTYAPRSLGGALLICLPTLWILSDAYLAGLLSTPQHPAPETLAQTATAGVGAAGLTAGDYLSSQAGVVCYYLGLILTATSQSLDYGWLVPEHSLTIWATAAGLIGLLALSMALWRQIPGLGLLALAYFVLLVPTSSVIPLRDLAVEHRLYLPSACVLTLLVLGVIATATRFQSKGVRQGMWAGLVLYAVFVTGRTIQRNADYHDDVRLWTRATVVSPDHPRNYGMLGVAWLTRGNLQQARAAFETSVKLYQSARGKPAAPPLEIANASSQLATVLVDFGETSRAQELLETAVELAPGVAVYWSNLGGLLHRQEQPMRAAACYRRALELDPRLTVARLNLARLLLKQAKPQEALAVLRSPQTGTTSLEQRHLLAETYRRLERMDEAHAVYQQLDEQQLATSDTWQARGKLYRQQGDYAAALDCFQTASRLNPRDPWPLALQAEMLARLGDFVAADRIAAALLPQLPADSVIAEQLRALRASLRPPP